MKLKQVSFSVIILPSDTQWVTTDAPEKKRVLINRPTRKRNKHTHTHKHTHTQGEELIVATVKWLAELALTQVQHSTESDCKQWPLPSPPTPPSTQPCVHTSRQFGPGEYWSVGSMSRSITDCGRLQICQITTFSSKATLSWTQYASGQATRQRLQTTKQTCSWATFCGIHSRIKRKEVNSIFSSVSCKMTVSVPLSVCCL